MNPTSLALAFATVGPACFLIGFYAHPLIFRKDTPMPTQEGADLAAAIRAEIPEIASATAQAVVAATGALQTELDAAKQALADREQVHAEDLAGAAQALADLKASLTAPAAQPSDPTPEQPQ